MATQTVTTTFVEAVTTTVSATAAATTTAVPPQGGILEGVLPNEYIPTNPIQLFIIQVTIIVLFCRLLHYPLSLINQPRVIAEVIGGILLGPSVMMRIPGFKDAIFPDDSQPVLNNVANLGLLLFLFLIGLEVDLRMFNQNWKTALNVGIASMILPFGLGFAVAWGLWKEFHQTDPDVADISFGVYGLFIGTAMAITAFPVLCRILTELNILGTPVGVTTLAAGVGNDVTGWVLLALCVALVNNGNGLTALYVLLVAVAWTLFLVFVVRPPFHWVLRRTGSIQNGPTQGMVTLTLILCLVSAWFTSIIGVHAIFGAFLVGLICPHEGGFAIKVTEKIEDLVTVLLLPIYFALSGLKTDLGLLNDGKTWGYVIAVIACAFFGKIIAATGAARATGSVWRESFSIGCLMSCKGLVELIVLNIGLQARILSVTTFTMFVVMAVVTTVATSPLTMALYPPWYQKKLEQWKAGEIDWDGNPLGSDSSDGPDSTQTAQDNKVRRLMVYLRLDSLPSLFTFINLLGTAETEAGHLTDSEAKDEAGGVRKAAPKQPLEVHALRILELTERTSSVMAVAESDDYSRRDPVVNAFRTFSQLNGVAVSGNVVVAPQDAYADTVAAQASVQESDFVLIPWSEDGGNAVDYSVPSVMSYPDRFSGGAHLDFIQSALAKAVCNTGIFINNGFNGNIAPKPAISRTISGISARSAARNVKKEAALPSPEDKSHHVFIPYSGGRDDRAALRLVFQLVQNPNVSATIAHLQWVDETDDHDDIAGLAGKARISTEITAQDLTLLETLKSSLPAAVAGRVTFIELSVSAKTAMGMAVETARTVIGQKPRKAGDIVVVGRHQPKLPVISAAGSGVGSSSGSHGGDTQRVLGSLGERFAKSEPKTSVLVVQAARAETQ